jgi:hypothetical protein
MMAFKKLEPKFWRQKFRGEMFRDETLWELYEEKTGNM